MRDILISFGVIVFCGVLLLVSSVFSGGKQTEAIAAEVTPNQPTVSVISEPQNEPILIAKNPNQENDTMSSEEKITTPSGLQYVDIVEGEGATPEKGQKVTVHYTGTLKDGSKVGHDLTGGYFDAGDFVKFNFPGASAITMLAWGIVEFPDGYELAGEYGNGLQAIKWATDYFIKCHTG